MQKEKTMKYSILIPYYKRALQLQSTLKSFDHFYRDRNDVEIILIVDNKNNNQDMENLETVLRVFNNLNIKRVAGIKGESFSPAANYNLGLIASLGEFLILTNPEAMHSINILKSIDEELEKSKDNYIVCSCLSVTSKYIPVEKLGSVAGKWYQHSNYRNTGCHFCSVISSKKYFEIGGFSEEFSAGIGFDDDDFRNKVQKAEIPFIYRDDLVTLHLNHDKDSMDKEKYWRNKNMYNEKWGITSFRAELLQVV